MQSRESRNIINKRSLLRSGMLLGAGAATLGAGLAMGAPGAFADTPPLIETPDTTLAGSPRPEWVLPILRPWRHVPSQGHGKVVK
jgi:hypothetical protein